MSILETIMSNIYRTSTPAVKKVGEDSAPVNADPAKLMKARLLAQLLPDSSTIVKGEVLDLRQNQILLKLLSGEEIDARTASPLPLSIGDVADFVVTANDGQVVTLKLANPDVAVGEDKKDQLAESALRSANIQVNDRSLTVVKELLNHSQSISTTNIRKYVSLSARYPEAPIKDLLLMDLNKIEINKENVRLYSEFNNTAAKILPELNKAVAEISEMISELSDPQVKEMLSSELEAILSYPATVPDSELVSDVPSDTATPAEVPTESVSQKPVPDNTDETPVSPSIHQTNTIPGEENAAKPTDVPTKDTVLTSESRSVASPSDAKPPIVDSIIPEDFSPVVVKKLYSRLKTVSEKLDKLMDRINEQQRAEALVKGLPKAAEETTAKSFSHTGSLNSTLKFMDTINNVFPYIQLPVKLKEENAHGELYVYEKKKALKNSESLSALLHLELDNLGPTDIYVKLSGTKVYTSFSVSDDKAEKIFESELPALTEALEKKGYSLSSDIKLRSPNEEKPQLLTEFLEAHSPSSVTRFSFDMRA